jgi:hypothetical protein
MALTDLFVPSISNCREISNAGSSLLITPLPSCAEEPLVYALEADAAVALLATSIAINVLTPTAVLTLRKGSRIAFGANYVVVTADTVVSTVSSPTLVPIEPAVNAIAANATASIWGALKVLSPTNLPIDNASQMVNRTDLSNGLQGAETKTKVMLSSQCEVITRPDDTAYWDFVFRAAQNDADIYALLIRGNDLRHVYGRAKVSNLNEAGQIEEINRVTFTLNFQTPFASPTLFQYLTVPEKAQLNLVRQYAGLAPLT